MRSGSRLTIFSATGTDEASRFPDLRECHQAFSLETVAQGHVLDPTWVFGEEAV
jgi:hypothetical protein